MKKILLTILDGVGINPKRKGNAFKLAKKPNIDYLMKHFPHSTLKASGTSVGLPKGQMGNSEVGHMTIGSGRVIDQDLIRINKSITDKSFFQKETFLLAIKNCQKYNSNLHLIGLVSDGGVHSHLNHLLALLDLCKEQNFDRVYIHALVDGRDTKPQVGQKYLTKVLDKISQNQLGEIITIGGRYYLMNRDRDYALTKKAYDVVVDGIGPQISNIDEAFKSTYRNNSSDEFMLPMVIKQVPINNNDSIIFFNYRSDRMIQFFRSLTDPDFKEFERSRGFISTTIVTMTKYEETSKHQEVYIAFKEALLTNTLGFYLSERGKSQIRISEFEKSAHVTYFFSGCTDTLFPGEKRIIFEKPDVFTYDESPAMRSTDITNAIIDSTKKGYDLIVVNYPNGDALGHTGIIPAVVKGIEYLDTALGKIYKAIDLNEYVWLITADHGNCEHMLDDKGQPDKKHTTNKVPFIVVNKDYQVKNGCLSDIAPTILNIMNMDIPKEMTGTSLIKGEKHVQK